MPHHRALPLLSLVRCLENDCSALTTSANLTLRASVLIAPVPKHNAEHAPATPYPFSKPQVTKLTVPAYQPNTIKPTHSAPHASAQTRMCIYDATHYACTAEDMVLVQQCPCLPHCLPHIRQTLFRTAVCRLCAIAGLEEGARIVSAAGVREEGGCYGGVARPWEMSGRHFRGEGAGRSGVGMGSPGGVNESICRFAGCESGMRQAGRGYVELFESMGHRGGADISEDTSEHVGDRQERDVDEEKNMDAM